MIPLFHADLLIEENVGTPEKQKELLQFIKRLSGIHENKLLSNGVIESNFYVIEWDELKPFFLESDNNVVIEKLNVQF